MYKKITLALASLVFLTSCGNTSLNPETVSQKETTTPINIGTEESGQDSSSSESKTANFMPSIHIAPEIAESEKYQSCIQEQTNYCINKAGTELAQETNNIEYCKYLENTDQRESCEFGIIFMTAITEQKSEICENLSNTETKKSCILSVEERIAITEKDSKKCENLETIIDTYASGASEERETINRVESCKFDILRNAEDFSAEKCSEFTDEFIKMECENFAETSEKIDLTF